MGLTKMGDTYSSYNVGTIQIRPRLCKRRGFIFSEKPCRSASVYPYSQFLPKLRIGIKTGWCRCYLHCRYSLVSRLKEERREYQRGVFEKILDVLVLCKQEKKIPRIHKVRITRRGDKSRKWRQIPMEHAIKCELSIKSHLNINL